MSTILDAQDNQFRLAEDGQVSYQHLASNPLPGVPVAHLEKGQDILKPRIVVESNAHTSGVDQDALQKTLEGWIGRHIATVLEPLVALENTDGLKPAVKEIAVRVHAALGIVPREQLESFIAQLDTEDRQAVRAKKIRLGPILVFIPALNKPAAVRLRALLWGLYNEKDLPMECPKDGIVSFAVDSKAVDASFYQAIAYPVYGSRAIRIDMLDRVISAVYDAADKGKFKAEHKMAEWLGSSIEGLYEVLEAMGHIKIHDPAQEIKETQEVASEPAALTETAEKPAAEGQPEEAVKPAETAKPELATFRLKKGKAFEKPQKPDFKKDKKPHKAKKPGGDKKKGKGGKPEDRGPKVVSVGPQKKLEDSPFAILEQLKKQSDGKS